MKGLKVALKGIGKDLQLAASSKYPTVFGIEGQLSAEDFSFQQYGAQKKALFQAHILDYIPPKDFNFKLPTLCKPEVALIGRSNVGKSSLIEALNGNRKVARVSKTPGCTKTMNFLAFIASNHYPSKDTNHCKGYMVDMPGYGFAKVNKEEQQKWHQIMQDYLLIRDQTVLRRVNLLVDGRHGVKTSDLDMMHMLDQSMIPYQMIFTKSDQVKEEEMIQNIRNAFCIILEMKSVCLPYIHTVSSHTGSGIETLQLDIASVIMHRLTAASTENEQDDISSLPPLS